MILMLCCILQECFVVIVWQNDIWYRCHSTPIRVIFVFKQIFSIECMKQLAVFPIQVVYFIGKTNAIVVK